MLTIGKMATGTMMRSKMAIAVLFSPWTRLRGHLKEWRLQRLSPSLSPNLCYMISRLPFLKDVFLLSLHSPYNAETPARRRPDHGSELRKTILRQEIRLSSGAWALPVQQKPMQRQAAQTRTTSRWRGSHLRDIWRNQEDSSHRLCQRIFFYANRFAYRNSSSAFHNMA